MKIRDILNEDMLDNFGLKKKSAVAPTLAAFGAGVLIGVGAKYLYGQMSTKRIGQGSQKSKTESAYQNT